MFKRLFLLSCSVSLLTIAGCNNSSSTSGTQGATTSSTSGPNSGGDKLTIAVIPKGTTHSYWKSVEAGARKAGEELGVNVIYKGPLKEDDRAQQISIVEQFVSQGTSAIVLAPLDNAALVKPVRSAGAKKIPVVIIDSSLKGKAGKITRRWSPPITSRAACWPGSNSPNCWATKAKLCCCAIRKAPRPPTNVKKVSCR
jgi:ABC-type sugar transport system substrate-binding protein